MRQRRPPTGIVGTLVAAARVAASAACSSDPPRPEVPLQSGPQMVLFEAPGITGLAADADGTVYAYGALGISTLAPGTEEPAPLANVGPPVSTLAAAPDGTLYFVTLDQKVEKLAPGSTAPQTLPFDGLRQWSDIAVGHDGTVYLGDNQNDKLSSQDRSARAPAPNRRFWFTTGSVPRRVPCKTPRLMSCAATSTLNSTPWSPP